MRKLKILFLISYTIILLFLFYRAYQAWNTSLMMAYLALISLWVVGVTTLSRIFDWIFHENTKLKQQKNKEIEQENKKKNISNSTGLLFEIEANQTMLQPIYDITKALEDKIKPSKDEKLPEGLYFKRDSYSSESGKLIFLSKSFRDELTQYYSKLKYIEEKYKKFDINGKSYDYLNYRKLREFGQTKKYKPVWRETENFLQISTEAYGLGEELIKRFKGVI